MKKSTIFSAVTVIAALALAGQALAFGGGGGSRGGGSAAFSHQRSSLNPQSNSRFTNNNPGNHLALGHANGQGGAGKSNGGPSQGSKQGMSGSNVGSSQGSKQGMSGSNTGQGRKGSSSGASMGSTGGSGTQGNTPASN